MRDARLVHDLAYACVMGEQSVGAVLARVANLVRGPDEVLRALTDHYLFLLRTGVRPRQREVVRTLQEFGANHPTPLFGAVLKRQGNVREVSLEPLQMQPAARAASWRLPELVTVQALADWLGVDVVELEWFADLRDLNRRALAPSLAHYHYTLRTKPLGGVRLIEAPQARLKAMQRQILAGMLDVVPPYYNAAHGFVKGRSVRTFAAPHVGKTMVVRMDLADFFPCISGARVQAVFRTLGYPESVADVLGGLCTTSTPRWVFGGSAVVTKELAQSVRLYSRPHLPQGAPTSPALANLCAFRLDCRLTGLADWLGAEYSRYADDIAISGDHLFARRARYASAQVAAIAMDEGWRVQHHKTRHMRQGVRQQLAGLTVNARLNVPRHDYDTLKATLTNCVRLGPETQNREAHPDFRAHLTGRVAWVASVNPKRGRRLQELLARVVWE